MFSLAFGCKDLTEDDLSGINLQVVSPIASFTTTNNTITFVFEEIEDAIDYKLVIVSPSFDNMQQYVLDSLLLGSAFNVNLDVGEYEWELVARNNSSESNTIRRKLFVEEATTLSEVYLQLTNPPAGHITNEDEITFNWDAIDGINTYHLQFYENNNGTIGSAVGVEYTTSEDTLSIEAPEGNLFWQMFVSDSNEQSPIVERAIIVDRTSPESPEILSPINGVYGVGNTVFFSWNYGEDLLTATYDSLYVFSEDLTEILYDSETINGIDSLVLTGFSLGSYYWRVRTFDQAGNYSQSTDELFTIE